MTERRLYALTESAAENLGGAMIGEMKRVQGPTYAQQELDEALEACAWVLEAIESPVTIERLVAERYANAAVTASVKVMRERQELADNVRKTAANLNALHDSRDMDPQLVAGASVIHNPGQYSSWLTWNTRPDSIIL